MAKYKRNIGGNVSVMKAHQRGIANPTAFFAVDWRWRPEVC